jgi:hypothetical protein
MHYRRNADADLRRLQRLVQSSGSPTAKDAYIAALERTLAGDLSFVEEHPHFNDAKIASVWIKEDPSNRLSQEFFENRDTLNAYLIEDVSGNRMGFMIDVFWENNYDPEDEILADFSLSEEAEQLLQDAADRGYSLLVFWV